MPMEISQRLLNVPDPVYVALHIYLQFPSTEMISEKLNHNLMHSSFFFDGLILTLVKVLHWEQFIRITE